jgi:anti-anti-sigma regulatory factor
MVSVEALARTERAGMAFEDDGEALKLLSAPSAFNHTPFAANAALMVLSGMIADAKQLKVLKPVVRLDAVPMVDMFMLGQLAAKMAFHKSAVLKNVEPVSGELNISVMADAPRNDSVSSNAASNRTEPDASSCSCRFDPERAAASFAGDIDHSRASTVAENSTKVAQSGTTLNFF